MQNKPTGLRSLPVNVWIVTATSFLTDVSSEMIVNLVPLFLANVLKAGTAIIGLIEGLAETTASLMKIYSGALSDKLGKRKWITVVGYALSTIAKPFMYFANTWHWVLGVRVVDRLGKGIRTAPRDALVAGSIDEKQRGLAFGVHRAGDSAGAFFGLMIAAVIVGGTSGILGIPPISILGYEVTEPRDIYWFAWAVVAMVYLISLSLLASRVGRALMAIREDETAASTMGIDVAGYKIKVFAISAVYAGIAGAIYAAYMGIIPLSLQHSNQ